jgi:hypothetical protein
MNKKKSKTTRNIIIVIITALLIGWGLLGEDKKNSTDFHNWIQKTALNENAQQYAVDFFKQSGLTGELTSTNEYEINRKNDQTGYYGIYWFGTDKYNTGSVVCKKDVGDKNLLCWRFVFSSRYQQMQFGNLRGTIANDIRNNGGDYFLNGQYEETLKPTNPGLTITPY